MKTFQFSVRVYIKGTRITPFILPRDGMYKCNWSEAGICSFEGIENGYAELFARLSQDYFHMDQPLEDELIEYYDRLAETLLGIRSQNDFETALMHSSQTYSPFSLVIKVNAARRDEHWYNGEAVDFGTSWRVSKPKFTCIRGWLISLQENGEVCKDISASISYAEKAFLYSQFRRQGSNNLTNHEELYPKMNQSILPKSALPPLKPSDLDLLEPSSQRQQMLHEKMMMDPTISMILFNEYIPLRQPPKKANGSSGKNALEGATERLGGLFLGKMEDEEVKEVNKTSEEAGGLFIRSEAAPTTGGLFLRSDDTAAVETDDWVIA